MRSLSLAGYTVIVALGLTVIFGAGPASATELCSTNTDPCSGTKYGSGTTVKAEDSEAVLATSLTTVTCTQTTTEVKTTSGGGEEKTVGGEITALTFAGCKAGGSSCSVEAKNLPYTIEIAGNGEGDGVLFVTAESGISATVKCGIFFNCTFTSEEIEEEATRIRFEGGNPAVITVEELPLEGTGLLCPESSSLSTEYQVSQPQPASTPGIWMISNPGGTFDFGKVKEKSSTYQYTFFRYIGGPDTRLLSVFVSNTKGLAFGVGQDGGGKPNETCKDVLMQQGDECSAKLEFTPEDTGVKEANVYVTEKSKKDPRTFILAIKGEGVK